MATNDLVQATVFIPIIIVAITQMLKMAFPQLVGFLTILVALAVGIVVALVDQFIGLTDINIAQGILSALEAVGVTALASKAGGGALGDQNVPRA